MFLKDFMRAMGFTVLVANWSYGLAGIYAGRWRGWTWYLTCDLNSQSPSAFCYCKNCTWRGMGLRKIALRY